MRGFIWSFLLTTLFTGGSARAADAVEAFERLKSLAGTWEVVTSDGEKATVEYEVIAANSAVVERFMGMYTIYHLDGAAVMMTHYCSAGNQPRLRVSDFSTLPNALDFTFLDVTNLKPGGGYISHLTLNFRSNDELAAAWSYTKDGNTGSETFILKRRNTMSTPNVISWFEIPVRDMTRAIGFYNSILELQMTEQEFLGHPMAFFPHDDGNVSGALVREPNREPSQGGVRIYLNTGDDLTATLNRVVSAGGATIEGKTLIAPQIGYYAVIRDTEGNLVALHSKN